MGLIKEYVQFLKKEKKYWLIPLIIIILVIGTMVVFFEGSVLAPFIYALF